MPCIETKRALLAGVAMLSFSLTPQAQAAEFKPAIALAALNGSNGLRLDGAAAGDQSGGSVAGAGDVNGDGFDDLIVGARLADPHGLSSGSSHVVFGRKGGFAAKLKLSTLNGSNGFRLDGQALYDESGTSVAAAGDVNGDGFGDVIVGAPGAGGGASYVVFGKKAGFAAGLDLSKLNGDNGFRLDGGTYDAAGVSVSAAGDVNGDGFADLIAGAPSARPNGPYSGSSYVVFGKAGGFERIVNLPLLNGNNGFRLDGTAVYDNCGQSVAAAGDVNGDGFADLVVAAPGAASSYVVFGKKKGSFSPSLALSTLTGSNGFRLDGASSRSVSGAGDVNGDGFGDVIVGYDQASPHGIASGSSYVVFGKKSGFAASINLSNLNGGNGFRLDGAAAGAQSGWLVSGTGDVNGDGFSDLIIGAFTSDGSGSSFVVFGKKRGFTSTFNLSSLNGTNGFRLDGARAGEQSGKTVSEAGDINGDGFADIIIGAQYADPNGIDAGSSYAVFGRAPDSPRTRIGSAAGQYISGGKFADRLSGQDGNDVLEGRGGGDVLEGGAGHDTASYAHASQGLAADLGSPSNNTGAAAGDSYSSMENVVGSAFDDDLSGNSGGNVISGGGGSDKLRGRGGGDIFRFLNVSESARGAKRDKIIDFNPGTGTSFVDRIDLSAIDAKPRVGDDQAFVYRGTKPFTGSPGEIRIRLEGSNVIIAGNVSNDLVADFEIQLNNPGNPALIDTSDFIR